MKNKAFYLIWVAYIAVVIFILNINHVFSFGIERTKMDILNIILNIVFLIVIGILFIISTVGFMSLDRLMKALSRVTELLKKEDQESYDNNSKAIWSVIADSKNHFGNTYLDKAFNEYRAQLKRRGRGFASVKMVFIDDFVNDALINKASLNHFNAIIPGTLTGLGILGTFIGLSLGLSSFSGDDIYTISDNVGPLLSGMKVAFHTSVYGIFFSLIFTFIYRSIMSLAYEKLDEFLTAFKYYTNQAPQESEATAAMLVYQSNMDACLKEMLKVMKGTSREQTEALSDIVTNFTNQMTYTLNSDFKMLGSTLNDVNASQRENAELNKNITATAYELIETNRQMVNSINMIAKQQKEIEGRLHEQERKLESTCDELSARLYTYDLANGYRE